MEVTAYEALVRWRHPKRGMVPPIDFIPIAEETGQIVRIGEFVLRSACRDISLFPAPMKVAVNFSPLQFRDPRLVDLVKDALQAADLAPSRLEIEITDSTLMQRDQRTLEQLLSLKKLGVQVAMDDFGTGYSSLSYLQSYPISCIKIDQSFIKTLGSSKEASLIVKAITTLAAGLKMSTVAVGVETREQLELVCELGCDEAQGFYFGRPLPMNKILLKSQAAVSLTAAA